MPDCFVPVELVTWETNAMIRNWKAHLFIAATALALGACETVTEGVSDSAAGEGPAAETAAPPPPPPPPPSAPGEAAPAPSVSRSDTLSGIVVTGSGGDRSLKRDAYGDAGTSPVKPMLPEDIPTPQGGLLTAGDYDDVLNPALYKTYLDKALQGALGKKDLPFVDSNQRITIKVTDRLGKPVPFARVVLTTADGQPMFPQKTGANGTVYLYPNFDAIGAGATVNVETDGQSRKRTFKLSEQQISNGTNIEIKLSGDAAPVQKLDLLLTLDATGSMGDEMRYLQAELTDIMDRVRESAPGLDIRAGLIVYRDDGDTYVVRDFPFTNDLTAFKENLMAQAARGGGDTPEAMQDAMAKGLSFDWRDDAVKVNLLVADAPPHDQDIAETWDSALLSRTRGIHIVPLAASGVDPTAEFLMRGMGQITGGRYLFLTDDSGIGNPHAEPTVDCYVVTRLDGLVERVLRSLVTGVRVEPDGDDVIRTVGDYRAGICKIE